MRIAVGIAYEGSRYCGWQCQLGLPTVQARIEEALGKVAMHAVRVVSAGRTDSGVHAVEQVIHFDTKTHRTMRTWVSACNYYLPHDIRALWAKEVPADFHARFSACTRSYRYLLYQGDLPWFRHHALRYPNALDIERMQEAACYLLGRHNFSAFRSAQCKAPSPVRTISQAAFTSKKPWIVLNITANAFLHHMVRNITGALLDVGSGKRPASFIAYLLETQNRQQAGITASPQGLYLQAIQYPAHFQLPVIQENLQGIFLPCYL